MNARFAKIIPMSINYFIPLSQSLARTFCSRCHNVARSLLCPWRIRVEQKEEEMPGETDATSRRNIARFRFLFALSPSRVSCEFHSSPSPFARSFCLSFLRLPFRSVIPPLANYVVVVASCHVIKLHLFTMKRDCHQAFDSVCVDHLLSTVRPRVVVITYQLTHITFKPVSIKTLFS